MPGHTESHSKASRATTISAAVYQMPCCTVSRDLKDRIPILHDIHGYSVTKICSVLGERKSLVYKTLAYHWAYGILVNPFIRKAGRHRTLNSTDLCFLEGLIYTNLTIYLDKMQDQLPSRYFIHVSIPTLVCALHCLDITHKVVSKCAAECDSMRRAAFMNQINDIALDLHMLVFLDESAWNARTSHRQKGWSQAGTHCVE